MKEAAEQMLGGFVFCSAPVCLVEGREDGGEVAVLDTAVSHHAAGGVVVQHGFADERELQGLTDPEPADEDGRAVDDLEDVSHLRVGDEAIDRADMAVDHPGDVVFFHEPGVEAEVFRGLEGDLQRQRDLADLLDGEVRVRSEGRLFRLAEEVLILPRIRDGEVLARGQYIAQ